MVDISRSPPTPYSSTWLFSFTRISQVKLRKDNSLRTSCRPPGLVRKNGRRSHRAWLQDLLLVPANAFHEEIAVKAFISVVSKAPGKALPRAGTLTCRIRFKLPNWQQEPVVQRAEDDTYLQLYRQMARKEQDNLTKMRKYPASARLQARKSALDSTLSRFLRVQMYIRHRLLLAKTWLEDIASGRTLNCKDIS